MSYIDKKYPNKTSLEDFINKSKIKHGDKYGYSLVEYKNSRTKIKIICDIHGVFTQNPNQHLLGRGCPKCGNVYKCNNKEFIDKLRTVHKNKYDYSLVEYKSNKFKIKIICPVHGMFEQVAQSHLMGNGCSVCSGKNKGSLSEFVEKAKKIHFNKYDYSLSVYSNRDKKLKIICPTHGVFEQMPHIHLKGHGCKYCNESKGEKLVKQILLYKNIKFIPQHQFIDCKYKLPLRFDFYLPEYNTCIEYDGKQHFEPYFKDINGQEFEKTKIRDSIKDTYCSNNKIKLIRIKYKENIFDILNKINYGVYR